MDSWLGFLGFHCCSQGSVPGQGTEILQAMWCGQKKKRKIMHCDSDYCPEFTQKA